MQPVQELKRELKSRHLFMIALGGVIGTGCVAQHRMAHFDLLYFGHFCAGWFVSVGESRRCGKPVC